MAENANGTNKGTIEQVIGVVVDVVFPDGLPEIYSALKIEIPRGRRSRGRSDLMLRGAAAPRRRPRPRGRDGRHRRPARAATR